ncbi:MAG TPA: ATP-binding protein [Thermoleophilaceae bacterium]|jgi:DNA replication protein DnaC
MLRPVPDGSDAERREVCPLGECDGSGWLIDEATNTAAPCGCRDRRIRRAAGGDVGTGIGRRFLEVSFDREPIASLDPHIIRHVRRFIRGIEEHLDRGRGLWFDGPVGTGKTSLAILVAKAARDAGRSYAVFPVPRLLAEIKRTYDRDATDNYLQVFKRLCSVDLLVLDDLGAEKQTEWVLEQLYSIVNERWQDERSIVVTTNTPEPSPQAPSRWLQETVRELRHAINGGRVDSRDLNEARSLLHDIERMVAKVSALDPANDTDAVVRLRHQIGARTVSRLREICPDDPISVMGPDRRVSAHGT